MSIVFSTGADFLEAVLSVAAPSKPGKATFCLGRSVGEVSDRVNGIEGSDSSVELLGALLSERVGLASGSLLNSLSLGPAFNTESSGETKRI